ncbi:hypothetical protein D9757_000638 [Collybiopsis confluens]|uniref:GLTSCR protein conserved domain-containing protein n=1 Tax=Collybiopsis confluens TaxID=2823264 RepID=A0A8H5MGT6_9AGAR|nr:hypothetical protein D9757_000638 [Collybiopsis confluens]
MSSSFSPSSSAVSTPTNIYQADSPYAVSPRSQTPAHAGPSTWRPPAHWNINHNGLLSSNNVSKSLKKKSRNLEDRRIIAETSSRIVARIQADHTAILSPDIETPFSDVIEAIDRLLPYHVLLQPMADLTSPSGDRKGKKKADGSDIKETRYALECHRRRRKLQERFRKARIKSGHGSEYNPELVVLMQSVLDADRAAVAAMNAELRAARSQYDGLERQNRASTSGISSAQPPTSARSSYHPPFSTTSTGANTQSPYYQSYTYAYAPSFSVPVASGTSKTYSTSAATSAKPTSSSALTSTFVAPLQAVPAPIRPNAIPVQLPVTYIPALNNLGIIPVAAETLIDGQPLPPAILRGSTSNGTILNLEINVSMLQPSQMSGLALILNSLMSRSSTALSVPSAPSSIPASTVSLPTIRPAPADQ